MARLMCFATHHKTGTVWINHVLKELAEKTGIHKEAATNPRRAADLPLTGRIIATSWSGYFPPVIWENASAAFLHLIRDPRDVLISGCAYHHTAPEKWEKFLHVPRDDLGGLTYQQHLNALDDPEDKLLFEMENSHKNTITEMRDWPYGDPRIIELRYEDLIVDYDCAIFRGALEHLGLTGADLEVGVQAFWNNSIFGGQADPQKRKGRFAVHISSNGQVARWKTGLSRRVGQIYAERYGADLIALGYERDMDWVRLLPEAI